ncbi:MAG: DHH family phosphoesterase [Aerococcus sp.]|nr:DHH family phosphoesterase [Aerococcus sp.]
MSKRNKGVAFPEFLKLPVIRSLLLIIVLVMILTVTLAFYASLNLGWVTLGLIIVIAALTYWIILSMSRAQEESLFEIAEQIETVENEILLQIPLGIIIFHDDGSRIRWMNPYMQRYLMTENLSLDSREVTADVLELYERLAEQPDADNKRIFWNEHYFDVGLITEQNAMYFLDVTRYGEIVTKAEDNRFVIGHILIDNYDETIAGYSDRRKSNIDNYVTKQLSAWGQKHNSFIKRLDDDRFLMLATVGELKQMEKDRFNIVDNIREATSKANFPLTISMGISYQEEINNAPLDDISGLAQSNLDLALSRGGDQVVIKTESQKARYYGGKTNPMEKRTHVRARQIATTISRMIRDNEAIYVMGHDYPDMDAIGASLGIRRIAEMNGKDCKIVINENRINDDISKLLVELRKNPKIANALISPEEAAEEIVPNALLFMVDCHRQSITIAPDLVDRVNGVVIIDHHRKGEEYPDNIILEYIEPYASSACELVTEFFEYQDAEAEPISRIEATAMLAGIIVDSRSFSLRTGSRTFDAASYLKSCGADSILIQEFLKEDLSDYIERSHLIENVQFVGTSVGIAAGEDDVTYPIVTAAQSADELLSMNGISASYVVYLREDGRVGISARSMGNVNVQTVMEALGGGGHLSNAATQLSDVTVSQAVEMLKKALKNLEEEEA